MPTNQSLLALVFARQMQYQIIVQSALPAFVGAQMATIEQGFATGLQAMHKLF
jgi:hypothetical protein